MATYELVDRLHKAMTASIAESAPPSALPSNRKATNVTLDADLLSRARALKINVSQVAEEGLRHAVASKQAALWVEENQASLESSNAYVEKHGLPLAKYRNF
jgi:antitoxin CcdA